MPSVPKPILHQKFVEALGGHAREHGPLDQIPLMIKLTNGVVLAVFAFTLTTSKSATNRPTGEYKIQLIVPGQERGTGAKARLPIPPGAVPLIAAWSPEHDVFVLWDGYAYEEFAYSRNVQVREGALTRTQVEGIAQMERRLRGTGGIETVVVARPDHLERAIRQRIQLSAEREVTHAAQH